MENKQMYARGESLHETIQKKRTHILESKIYKTRKQTKRIIKKHKKLQHKKEPKRKNEMAKTE